MEVMEGDSTVEGLELLDCVSVVFTGLAASLSAKHESRCCWFCRCVLVGSVDLLDFLGVWQVWKTRRNENHPALLIEKNQLIRADDLSNFPQLKYKAFFH